MFELVQHAQCLHINFGATQIGISNGDVHGISHAGHTSTWTTGNAGVSNVGGGGELSYHLHNGGTAIGDYHHDFGHNHIDNVTGSDVNGSDGIFGNGDDVNQGDWFEHSSYLKADQFAGDDFIAGGRGAFGDYAVHALWTDTTTMNGDKPITGVSVHGSVVTPKHIATAYANNDTDNNKYWSNNAPPPGGHGDNGWQRGQNGYY
jgi:hypothetical protein